MDTYKLKIKEIRRRKGLTQKKLAEKIGVSRSYFADLENGKYDIKLSLLIMISEILEVGLFDLIEINI
jgi:transcriptional regulator with XRE-family HTH domain